MSIRNLLMGAAAALAFAGMGSGAQAAPLGNIHLNSPLKENSAVQNVAWVRRCHWHRGHRHCRRVWRETGYYYSDPYYSGAPYAYGPGLSFYFGGGRGHHHHHHHRGHRR
jgi:hypothetical protein